MRNGKNVEVEFTRSEANIFQDGHWSRLVSQGSLKDGDDYMFSETPYGFVIKTWYGIVLEMSYWYEVYFMIPDFYINNVVGICGTNDFDKSDEFRMSDGTIIEPDVVDHTLTTFEIKGYFRTDQEYQCAESWRTGKMN